eukprot:1854518-Amphidinium_carterae.1
MDDRIRTLGSARERLGSDSARGGGSARESARERSTSAQAKDEDAEEEVLWETHEEDGLDRAAEELKRSQEVVQESSNATSQQLAEMIRTLQETKALTERVLEQNGEASTQAASEVITAVMEDRLQEASGRVGQMSVAQVGAIRDVAGMTLVHHAVRAGSYRMVWEILQKCPDLANAATHARGPPSHWTALMVLCDLPKVDERIAKALPSCAAISTYLNVAYLNDSE